jgi:hypothetical protein
MKTMIVLFNLKPEVNHVDYEQWARETDVPIIKSLQAVSDFRVHRSFGLLGSEAKPPYQYIEVTQIKDLDQLGEEVQSEKMQQVVQTFQQFAENPVFILTEQFA